MRRGITVAGSLLADVFYNAPTYPKEGMLIQAKSSGISIGGTGNIILDLARLDPTLEVTVSARLGEDGIADDIITALSAEGNVDTSHVVRRGESSKTIVINSADTKARTFFYIPAASDEFEINDIPFDKINSKIFLLEYLLLMKKADSPDEEYGTHGARILAEAKKRGMITSVDVVSEAGDRARGIVSAALKYTDICCINELEASAVTEIDLSDIDKCKESLTYLSDSSAKNSTRPPLISAFERIRELGVSKWIIIHTSACGFGFDCESGEVVCLDSLRLPKDYIKGSTGAGDAYCSGILYGAHEGKSLRDSMRIARAAAAASLSENNGTDGMRPLSEIMKLEELYG